jgi:hypothetical protein
MNGMQAVCNKIAYTSTDFSTVIIGAIFLGGLFFAGCVMLMYREHINQQWHRCLVETGHEQAWIDVVKSVRKYVIPKKDDRIGGAEPGLE